MDAPLGLDRGSLTGVLVHEFEAWDKDWVGVVILAALASLEFASPSSMPWPPMGELGCRHSSPSRRWNGLMRDHSIFVLAVPFPELGRGG